MLYGLQSSFISLHNYQHSLLNEVSCASFGSGSFEMNSFTWIGVMLMKEVELGMVKMGGARDGENGWS